MKDVVDGIMCKLDGFESDMELIFRPPEPLLLFCIDEVKN